MERWAVRATARAFYGTLAWGSTVWARLANLSRPRRRPAAASSAGAGRPRADASDIEERFAWFLTRSRDVLLELTADGRIRYASPNASRIGGYTPEDLDGRSIFEFVHPDDVAQLSATWFGSFGSASALEFTTRFRHKDGRWLYFEGRRCGQRKTSNGSRVAMIVRDVTDKRVAEDSARSSEARLSVQLEQTPVATIGWSDDGRISSWNRAAVSIFGFGQAEALGTDGSQLLGRPWALDQRTGRTTRHNWTKDGRKIICEWNDTPVVGPDGAVQGVVSIVQDVTERVRAQEALRDSEAAIRSLYEVTSAAHIDFHEKVDAVLGMGCAFLHLPSGIVTRLVDDEVEIIAAQFSDERFRRGARFPLANMYSGRMIATGETLAIHDGSGGAWADLPAHKEFHLEAYIGTPVRVRGEIYGTISFAGKEPRSEPFSETEIDFIRLIAQWLGLALERQSVEEELRHNALHDALTGLPNQRLFSDRLAVAMSQAKRSGEKLAVCFVDLDRFKVINDTLGHRVGDALLKEVTARLSSSLREVDTLARLGGDEFVVLLTSVTDAASAGKVAQRLLDSLEHPVVVEGRELFVTASVGISLFPDAGSDPETLIKNADHAMYRAKETGRDTYQIYVAADGLTSERLALETALRRAIKNDELRLHYQPQIDIASDAIVGIEALVRWQHPELGLVPPSDFIPLAEETGLIVPIGRWVIESACRQAAQWRTLGFPPFRIAVNVSARQFRHRSFVESLQSILDASGLDPSALEIELTESVTMHAGDAELQALARLKFLGVRLALDDFGTGFASLSNLKRLPVDVVKVDRSFVSDCLNSTDDAAIVKAVVSMGHALRLQVIAEGVETREQLAFLQLLGCDCAQGYYIGAPMPAHDFERLIAQRAGAFPAA